MSEVREVTATPVLDLTTEQESAFRAKVEQLQAIESSSRTERITSYYNIGTALIEVFEDRERGELRYGPNAIQRLAVELGAEQSTLYRAQEVATRFTPVQIAEICEMPRVCWSHVLEVVRLPSSEQRMAMLEHIHELPASQQSVAALRARVQEVRGAEAAAATPEGAPEEAAAAPAAKKGGGSRTGTGHGSSPLTPIKRAFKGAEALRDNISNILIMLKEFDPDSEAVAERVAKELDATVGVVVEVMAAAAGSLSAMEEHIAQFNYKDSQAARRSMVSQSLVELQSFLNGEKAVEARVREEVKAEKEAVREMDGKGKAKAESKAEAKAEAKAEPKGARAEARPVVKAGPKPVDKSALQAVIDARRKAALEETKRRT